MDYKLALFGCIAFAVSASAPPASADDAISVFAAPEFVTQSTSGDAILFRIGAGYDLGPRTSVPLRVRLDLSDAFGIGQSASGDNVVSGGVSVRLTTPLYAGAGVSVDGISLPSVCCYAGPAILPGDYIGPGPKTSAVGFGSNFFLGQKVVSKPGFGLAVEASYRLFPSFDSSTNSAFGIGLRASFL